MGLVTIGLRWGVVAWSSSSKGRRHGLDRRRRIVRLYRYELLQLAGFLYRREAFSQFPLQWHGIEFRRLHYRESVERS